MLSLVSGLQCPLANASLFFLFLKLFSYKSYISVTIYVVPPKILCSSGKC